jgi:hypothetical protein
VIVNIPVLVGADVSVKEPKLVIFDQAVGILKVGKAASNGLDLRTR